MLGNTSGAILSPRAIFLNEQYRIGGARILRGFDEEAINASLYSIFTVEYRFIIARNSHIYLFCDYGYVESKAPISKTKDTPLGFGAGMTFDTKIGVFGIGLAYGRQFDNPVDFNRKTSDGVIALFRKSGTSVGSIGTYSGGLDVAGSTRGLRITDGSVFPVTNAGSVSDNYVNLGYSGGRFKDLYLSGGVYLGGTGAANLLDDYEEGTWNGVITDGTNNATMADTECFYTKTGRLVTLSGDISTSALGSVAGSSIRISGVPFTNGAKGVSAAIGRASGLAITAGYIPTLYFDASSSALRLGLFDNAGGTTTLQATEWTDDGQISFSITYMTS